MPDNLPGTGEAAPPAVRLSGVAKRYADGTLAVREVDLAVPRGEFLSLLGPSGCGKSTLLRMVAGLIRPSGGQVAVDAPQAGEVGFVFQEPTLMPWSTALRNVMLPLRIARALVTRPRLLLMDEPFAALDEITRHRLNNDLLELWQAARFTAVFVTHSVFESVYLSQRIVVMAARPGRIHEEVQVDAPYPRGEAFRTSADYAALCRRTSEALSRAMAA